MGALSSKSSQQKNVLMMDLNAHSHFAQSQLTLANNMQVQSIMAGHAQAQDIINNGGGYGGNGGGGGRGGYQNQTPSQMRQQILVQFVGILATVGPYFFFIGIALYLANYFLPTPFLSQIELFFVMFVVALSSYYAVMHSSVYYRGWVYTGKYTVIGTLISATIAAILSFAVFRPKLSSVNDIPTPPPLFNEHLALTNAKCITHEKEVRGDYASFLYTYLLSRGINEARYCVGGLDFIAGTSDERESDALRIPFGFASMQGAKGSNSCQDCEIIRTIDDTQFSAAEITHLASKIKLFYQAGERNPDNIKNILFDISGEASFMSSQFEELATIIRKKFGIRNANQMEIQLVDYNNANAYAVLGYKTYNIKRGFLEALDLMIGSLFLVTTSKSKLSKIALLLRNKPFHTVYLDEENPGAQENTLIMNLTRDLYTDTKGRYNGQYRTREFALHDI